VASETLYEHPFETLDRSTWAARCDPAFVVPDWPDRPGDLTPVELREVYAPLVTLIADRLADPAAADRTGPYLVWVSGSVAVGKSTAARALARLLVAHDRVGPVTSVATDGFLFPNHVLADRGLMDRKGFPESFDVDRLRSFLGELRAGRPEVRAPVYSHELYDVTDEEVVVRAPAVVVLEGLPIVADGVDLELYLDAAEVDIETWYIERFLALRREAMEDDSSFFRMFAGLDQHDAVAIARQVWTSINLVNLREHILPTRDRADVVFEKGPDHAVRRVHVRTGA
jgi:type I pantothenate kinase